MLNLHTACNENGLEFVFNYKAAGMHFADRSFRAWLDAAYTYGRNDVIFARDRNQEWLLPTVHQEFKERHRLIRSLVRLCSGRAQLTQIASMALKFAADAATFLQIGVLERTAYSALFNLQYYHGFLNELNDVHFLSGDLREQPV